MVENERDEQQYQDTAEAGGAEATRPRRRGRTALLFLLSLAVLIALALDAYYLLTRKPLTELLPPAVAVAKALPPRYVTSFYGVSNPMGVAVSPDAQRIYVAESTGDRLVRAYDRAGQQLFSFAPPDSTIFDRVPVYLATDAEGRVFVADRHRHRISIYNPDGRFVADVEPPAEAPFAAPLGVAFDRAGNLLVTDATKDNHSVIILDPQGRFLRRLGKYGEGPGELIFPNQAAADSRGRIYVTNGNMGRVEMFGPDGAFIGTLGGGTGRGAVNMPRGIAIDNLERLYVVDSVGCAVQVFDVSGEKPTYLFSFGTEGIGDGQMRYPTGIAVDATGRVYVADRANNRLQVWSY